MITNTDISLSASMSGPDAMTYEIPEKSTQLIEYYWDCVPAIGLRPVSVHTRNRFGVRGDAFDLYS